MVYLVIAAAILWVIILLLPWQPWRNREAWEAETTIPSDSNLADVTVLIPARNEAEVISQTLNSVVNQGKGLKVVLIDDNSTDDTRQQASKINYESLIIVSGTPKPDGWTGKLWALEQGRKFISTPFTMLLDSDIALSPGVIHGLRDRLHKDNLRFISLMAKPSLNSFWEKLLMPAFVYFFKLLYPFHLSNSTSGPVAAAAGGCVMMYSEVLNKINGFKPIRAAIIDDCALARQVKNAGFKTWLGLTHSVKGIRPYKGLREIWDMVARTAFSKLQYSIFLLLGCTVLMILAFLIPLIMLVYPDGDMQYVALGTLLIMYLTYLPTIMFYGLSWSWGLLLPFIAILYLGMTWTSAIRFWKGERMRWRGRIIRKQAVQKAK